MQMLEYIPASWREELDDLKWAALVLSEIEKFRADSPDGGWFVGVLLL
jgi:hypothetical protein